MWCLVERLITVGLHRSCVLIPHNCAEIYADMVKKDFNIQSCSASKKRHSKQHDRFGIMGSFGFHHCDVQGFEMQVAQSRNIHMTYCLFFVFNLTIAHKRKLKIIEYPITPDTITPPQHRGNGDGLCGTYCTEMTMLNALITRIDAKLAKSETHHTHPAKHEKTTETTQH